MTRRHGKLESSVRDVRQQAGLTQEELARRCGMSRQALIAIESDRAQPSIAIALGLAHALGKPVEELFRPSTAASSDGALDVELAAPLPPRRAREAGPRVALAHIAGRWVAHPLRPGDPVAMARAADGIVRSRSRSTHAKGGKVALLRPMAELANTLFVVGCDPALGLVTDRVGDRASRAIWLHAPSHAALDLLARGHTHVAGVHLFDESSGEYNVPFVRRLFAERRMLLVTLASCELGLATRQAQRVRGSGARALCRALLEHLEPRSRREPRTRFIHREPGAGARALVERLLRQAGASPERLARAPVAHGHLAVAQAIAAGGADAGVTTRAAALAHELAFAPLADERFDLVIPGELERDPRVVTLIETLHARSFRRELACLGGYETRRSGSALTA